MSDGDWTPEPKKALLGVTGLFLSFGIFALLNGPRFAAAFTLGMLVVGGGFFAAVAVVRAIRKEPV